VQATLEALKSCDFVYLHIEAPDEAGHEGDTELKVRAIELFERSWAVVEAARQPGLARNSPARARPFSIKTHSRDPVPFAITGAGIGGRCNAMRMQQGGAYGLVEATKLVGMIQN
jgi:2,3-bisphosphoglycerate-independent phosphoglycerate mutase